MESDRVIADHKVMGGVPVIRGTRVPVATIVGLLADGYSEADVLGDHPQLAADDVRAALAFAAVTLTERQLPLRPPA